MDLARMNQEQKQVFDNALVAGHAMWVPQPTTSSNAMNIAYAAASPATYTSASTL